MSETKSAYELECARLLDVLRICIPRLTHQSECLNPDGSLNVCVCSVGEIRAAYLDVTEGTKPQPEYTYQMSEDGKVCEVGVADAAMRAPSGEERG